LLTAISIESCVSILCPLRYRCRRPRWLSAVVCALLWALSITLTVVVTSQCLYRMPRHCHIPVTTMMALYFIIFILSMIIYSSMLVVKVLRDSQRHQPRRLYIVIFLTILFFLLFSLPFIIRTFLQELIHFFVSSQIAFLLACIKSSINPFIYFLVGCCQRPCSFVSLQVAFRRVFEQ
ncbi:Proto-oncogene Mas, partial [Buceros rhinoceros silvestris]